MMQIYLIHPRHGKKIACQSAEAESDKKVGWKEVSKEQFFPPLAGAKQEDVNKDFTKSNTDLTQQYEEKFGKKPHHRMTDKSIENALND